MQEPLSLTKLKTLIEQNQNGAGEYAIAEGLHAVKHALRFNAEPKIILAQDKKELIKLSNRLCPDISKKLEQVIELKYFDKLTDFKIRTKVLGIFYKPKPTKEIKLSGKTVLLDNPRDLNNIGAVIRVCAAAGIKNLILTGDSNPWNTRAIRAAAGLQFALHIYQADLKQITKLNFPMICFDERGRELSAKLKLEIPKDSLLVFGSERDGISEELKLSANNIIRLPMQEGVSSMNLATSVSAALYSLK
jgi:tRNA G18 (ribose-2'-O)-methylase SpoU